MDLSTALRVRGRVEALLLDASGAILDRRLVDNLVVNAGLTLFMTQAFGTTSSAPVWLAFGSSTTPTVGTMTALQNEYAGTGATRKQATGGGLTFPSPGTALLSVTWLSTENPSTTAAEIGLFTASSAGTMLSRAVFNPVIAKDQFSQFQANYQFTISSS